MKKIFLLFAVVAAILTSCQPYLEPVSDFESSTTTAYTYENIQFYNYSRGADEYEWDFGDGVHSNYVEPEHYYAVPGVYTVRLAAYHHNRVDYSYLTINIIGEANASLNVQVLEYYKHYPVAGASIILYPTYADWSNQTNKIIEVYTNANGIAVVNGLEPGYYYLDIWEQNHNNYALADEDVNYIKTPLLVNRTTTYFTAYVDYTGTLKSASTNRRGVILKTGTHRVYSDSLNIRK